MNWKLSNIATTLSGILWDSRVDQQADGEIDDIREEMLGCIAPYVEGMAERPPVWSKLMYAQDMQALWYQRSEMMQILSEHCGETAAADTLERITLLFRDHIPAALFASAQRRK